MGMDDYGDEDEVDTCFSVDLLLPDQQVMMIAHGGVFCCGFTMTTLLSNHVSTNEDGPLCLICLILIFSPLVGVAGLDRQDQ